MTTAADLFPHLANMTPAELAARRKELLGDRTTVKALSDAELDECATIVGLLRRKSSGPPRDEKPKATKAKGKTALSDDALLNF